MIPHRFARLLGAVLLLAPTLALGQAALQQPVTSGKPDNVPVAFSKLYANDLFLQTLVANRFATLGPAAFLNIGTVTGSLADGGVLTAEIARAKGVEQANALAIQSTAAALATETSRAQVAEALKAPIASPSFTGVPTVPTADLGAATTQVASTAFVGGAVSGKANQADLAALASATLDAVNGKLDLSGGTMTGALSLPSVVPSLTVSPTGNPTSSLASMNVQGTTGSATTREFLVNLGMVSNQGASSSDPTARGKVTLYTGMDCYAGSGDCWSYNPLLNLRPGVPDSATGQTVEIDLNNLQSHRGDTAGVNTLTAPNSYGLTISGGGFFRNTAALSITGSISNSGVTGSIWNTGIIFPRDSIRQQTILDNSAAPTILKAYNARTIGLDLSSASFTTAAALMPANASLSWNDSTATPRQMLDGDGGGNLNLGRGAAAILARVNALPAADATLSLGTPGNRWASAYTAAVLNTGSLTLAAGGTGTVNLQTARGVQARVSDTAATPTAYVNMTGTTSADGAGYVTITPGSGSLTNVGMMVKGLGTNGTLTGVFTKTADPTTADIPTGTCADWNNTTAATFKHVCNFGGTLRSVAMN